MSAPDTTAIPAELKSIPNWVTWRSEIDAKGETTKVLYNAVTSKHASSTDSTTWTSFENAVAALNAGIYDGLGYVFTREAEVMGIDLDHCINTAGNTAPWALGILNRVKTYAERSPVDGIHLLGKGTLPEGHRCKVADCEIYTAKRYFTVTGNKLTSSPATIEPISVNWLYDLMISRVFDFESNEKYARLMAGDWQGFPSQSEADLSLCSLLAGMKLDAGQIDCVFRMSGLFRSKWDASRGDSTYGAQTIATVLGSQPDGKKSSSTSTSQSSNSPAVPDSSSSPYSEDQLAQRFTTAYGKGLRLTAEAEKWFAWDGRVWQEDKSHLVLDLSREICRQASLELDLVKPGKGRSLASYRTISAVERIARTATSLAVGVSEWDTQAMLFNCESGVVDLCTGDLLSHNPALLLSKIAGCKIASPGTPAPLWSQFLSRITDCDHDLESYLQRLSGYALTGLTTEQMLTFLYGLGANGKSVFLSTLMGILGDYSRSASMETFLASATTQHPCDLAALCGARLVTSVETERGRRWSEAKVLSLTGSDRISARFMRQDFFEFTPVFKLFIAGNHKPAVRSVNEAIRRRMHLVPFTVTIPPPERDPLLTEKLRAEWPVILRWAVDGCLQWQAQGLNPPAAVTGATAEYLAEENTVELWIESNCILKSGYFTSISALYRDWKNWTEQMGEFTGSVKSFSQSLETVEGVHRFRRADARGFGGITLRYGDHEPETYPDVEKESIH